MVFDPRADPFGSSKSECRLDSALADSSMAKSSRKSTWRANPIDVMVLEGVRRLAHLENCSGRFPNLERVIREVRDEALTVQRKENPLTFLNICRSRYYISATFKF